LHAEVFLLVKQGERKYSRRWLCICRSCIIMLPSCRLLLRGRVWASFSGIVSGPRLLARRRNSSGLAPKAPCS